MLKNAAFLFIFCLDKLVFITLPIQNLSEPYSADSEGGYFMEP